MKNIWGTDYKRVEGINKIIPLIFLKNKSWAKY